MVTWVTPETKRRWAAEDFGLEADRVITSAVDQAQQAFQQAQTAVVEPARQSLATFVVPGLQALTAGWEPPPDQQQQQSQPATTSAPASAGALSSSPLKSFSVPSLSSLLAGWEAPPAASGGPPSASTGTASPMPTTGAGAASVGQGAASDEMWARSEARRLGIDPDVAVRVANTEGGFLDPTRQNMQGAPAYGPYQLYIGGRENPGLGDEALLAGIDPRNAAHSRAAITFALEHAAKNGWRAFQGAAANGIGDWDGIGTASTAGATAPAPAAAGSAPAPMPSSGAFGAGEWTPNQYQQAKAEGLDDETAWAVCGPAAAIAFARRTGRNPTMREALDLAQQVGWTKAAGMAGTQSQQRLLERMGIASRLEMGAPNWQTVAADVQRGNPVIIDAGDHYMVAERYDPETGAFDFGQSAAVLRMAGGRRWFRPDELPGLSSQQLRINPEAAIFLDNPASPTPSVSAGRSAQAAPPPAAPWAGEAGATGDVMARQPIGQPTSGPDTFDTGSPAPDLSTMPADPDQGPRELPPPSLTYDPRRFDQGPREGGAFQVPAGGQDDPGTQTTAPAIPPRPYQPEQAASMEPVPDRFTAPGPTLTQRVADTIRDVFDVTPVRAPVQSTLGEPDYQPPSSPRGIVPRVLQAAPDLMAGQIGQSQRDRERYAFLSTMDANARAGRTVDPITGYAVRSLTETEQDELAALNTAMIPGAGITRTTPAASTNPFIRDLARQMRGEYRPSGVEARPLLERITAALTDRNAIHGAVEREIQDRLAASGIAAPLTRLAERVRVNPNSVAAERLRLAYRRVGELVGEDEDWLAQYLVNRHNLDIAKAKAAEAYDAAIARGRSPRQAQAIADRVRTSRTFSGGVTEKETIQALADMQREMGPDRFKNVVNAADEIWRLNRETLDAKLAEGMITPQAHQALTTRYPHYVRTDIADYFERAGAGGGGGKTLGVSDVGIKRISAEGTAKDRVNPLLSTIDAAYQAEGALARQRAARDLVALRDADPEAAKLFREIAPNARAYRASPGAMLPEDYALRGNEQALTFWENGQARRFVIPGEYAQLLTPKAGGLLGDSAAAQGIRAFFNLWKALITTHNPAFQYIVSPVRDFGDYVVGEATRSARRGGVAGAGQAVASIPGVVADYVRALPAAFEGLGRNQVGAEVSALRRAGAGFEGRPMRSDGDLRAALADLKDTGGLALRTPEDVRKAVTNLLTLFAEPIGSRLEMVPRIAAARRAAGRGADALGQSTAYKDATIDFLRGGWAVQQLNAVVPFMNPTVQSAAQVGRLYRRNPKAFASTVATAIGVPTLLAEAWNRSDPDRALAYEDVPDYIKNGGITIMLPDVGVDGSTDLGERKPNYLWVPLGSYAFASRLAREALATADPLTGLTGSTETVPPDRADPLYWAGLGAELLAMFSPVKGDSLSSSVASLFPPVASEIVELGIDKDLYRGNQIATDRRDEMASRLSQGVSAGLNAVTGAESRPSQVEHFIRGTGGYFGTVATAASDLGRDKGETRPIQDIPVVGGLTGRVVRDAGGQRAENERKKEARVPAAIRDVLAEANMRTDEVLAVPFRYKGAQLTRGEQERWQRATNAYVLDEVLSARDKPAWDDPTKREQAIRQAVSRAQMLAARDALGDLSAAEVRDRIEREQARKGRR